MEWLAVTIFFWILQVAKSHPFSKLQSYKSSEKHTPQFEIVYPLLHSSQHRGKRSLREDERFLIIKTSNDAFYIELEPNQDLTDSIQYPNSDQNITENCHYHGILLSHMGGLAAISMCGTRKEMSGVITTENQAYVLRPLTHLSDDKKLDPNLNVSKSDGAHVLMKVKHSSDYCGGDYKEIPLHIGETDLKLRRVRRSESEKRKVIETAVYVDFPLYQKLSVKRKQPVEEMQDTVLAILNEVQLIYNYQSLKTKFKIAVVKLEILSEGKEAPDAADGDIDEYLDNFCLWQSTKNPAINSDAHWDHALMLTGHDLHKVVEGNEKNKKVLGLAWVNGMCRPKHSCTLNEGSSFEAAFVIAHEMGHSLGMMHDGRGNDCNPSTYLMSEKTGPGRITWSSCSNDYLDRFFQKGYGACLDDDNDQTLKSASYKFGEQLPGQRFDLEEQCKLSLGNEFKPHVVPKLPFNDVCRELWCVSGLWASVAHPALEGSSCANGKQCIQGKCVELTSSSSLSSPSNAEIVEDMKGAVAEFLDKLKTAFHLLAS
ncbi:A disintegrin and metalloproteinase with thrombospondin motifs adt-1 [Parasteatoda tepidariorum]|uniref:A disintegrin and metalloproteinase with thrombospondin motifs adt-1 n=1 Tax=Parasteatoda tepidariorum TaxID=114398 RepID=UPI00077FA722|nr:A disintegrin and metalloproteinase with thrombospondin motifs adt-1 [Parasteatoda tepidariorum]